MGNTRDDLRSIENLLTKNSVMSQFEIKLNHGDTATLSYTGDYLRVF